MENTLPKFVQSITQYFRQSLLDSERLSPDVKTLQEAIKAPDPQNISKDRPFSIHQHLWDQGQFPLNWVEVIFKNVSPKINEIPIVLMPRIELIKVNRGQAIGDPSPVIIPLIAEVLMDRLGQLKPSHKPPIIPREYLSPTQSDEITFASLDILDQFITLHPFNAINWLAFKQYCGLLLLALVDSQPALPLSKDEINIDYSPAVWETIIHPDYKRHPQLSLALLEPPIQASFHMVKLLDTLLKDTQPNALYQRLIRLENEPKLPYLDKTRSCEHSQKHIAQMTREYALSAKQRNTLHYLMDLNTGEMLAVNGPPGTGKTTLLSSVVANLWVSAALGDEQAQPPIIAATSSNNQAVTNILESFNRATGEKLDKSLIGRWLPNINTYGLYGCARNKANRSNPFVYSTPAGEGLMAELESEAYIEKATVYFLKAFHQWHGSDKETLTEAVKLLHQALKHCVQQIQDTLQYFATFKNLQHKIKSLGGALQFEKYIHDLRHEQNTLQAERETMQGYFDAFLSLWHQRPLLQRLFSFLPAIKNSWYLDNEILARKLKLETRQYDDKTLRHLFSSLENNLAKKIEDASLTLINAQAIVEKLIACKQQLTLTLSNLKISLNTDDMNLDDLTTALDTGPRFQAFQLATHYWEARWLVEVSQLSSFKGNSPKKLRQRYQRYAKLTPCFVSTFNMLPAFFMASVRQGNGWKNTPLIDEIELLIIDEAGQALPHAAAASFALAKKVLLVGDTHQIEPVYSLSAGIDRANLTYTNLMTPEQNYDDCWLPSALLASSGNLMQVAHRQVKEQQLPDLDPGLYLTEHRRCYNDIIKYCNDLVYNGHLEPLRGNPATPQALPLLGFVHIDSSSQISGKSRFNTTEAEAIMDWIIINRNTLESKINLGNTIVIITPFAKQASVIKRILQKNNLLSVKVGTVHTFQGAESNVVLFSSVYGANDQFGTKFYDRGSNMLNVAVSRAKNSFIVFGHRDVFGKNNPSSPSGLLMKSLTTVNEAVSSKY